LSRENVARLDFDTARRHRNKPQLVSSTSLQLTADEAAALLVAQPLVDRDAGHSSSNNPRSTTSSNDAENASVLLNPSRDASNEQRQRHQQEDLPHEQYVDRPSSNVHFNDQTHSSSDNDYNHHQNHLHHFDVRRRQSSATHSHLAHQYDEAQGDERRPSMMHSDVSSDQRLAGNNNVRAQHSLNTIVTLGVSDSHIFC
jgi:hypothetical protein